MAAEPGRKKKKDKGDAKADRRLHPEPLHLGALPEREALEEPEALHPEPLHLEHVDTDESEGDDSSS